MNETIFYPSLNDFCQTYLVANRQPTPQEIANLPTRVKEEQGGIFEQLMLFDKISFKVHGENILVPFLINLFGQHAFESLIEQSAIGFVLWTPMISYIVADIPGLMPLQSGALSSPAHCDPEQSIELGFRWSNPALPRSTRRHLTKKLLPLYELPPTELSHDAVKIVTSSFNSGKLKLLNFLTPEKDITTLSTSNKKLLCNCATELLEYTYLIKNRMTSFSNYHYFSLFNDSVPKIQSQAAISTTFNRLANLEGFPDLKALHAELDDPFKRLPKLRNKRSSVKFREWLATGSFSKTDTEIVKDYIDSIAEAKGFFETKKGKITKSIAMTSIGTGIGAAIGGAEGALGGATVAKILEPTAEFVLDLIDEFLISGLTKGWSPKIFFNDLSKFRESEKQK